MADRDATEMVLDKRLGRLEEIVALLERDELELDDALELFEEGVAHLRAAEEVLGRGELRIERLLEESGAEAGEPVVVAMDGEGRGGAAD